MTGWIAQTLLASTLLMIVVAALRRLLSGRVGPKFIYALWLLPALRMAIPPLPLLDAEPLPAGPAARADASLLDATRPDLAAMLLTVWLIGAFLWLAWQCARYWHFLRTARSDRIETTILASGIPVHGSGVVDGPVAVGIWRREILIPLDFEARFDPCEQHCALAHEAMHHRRRDLLANLAAMVVLALHWFNPFAHRAHLLFRGDQELACDADVLRKLGQAHAGTYARTLLKATAGGAAVLCRLSEVALLKHRLRGLALDLPQRRQGHIPALVLALGGGALVLSAATRVMTPSATAIIPVATSPQRMAPQSARMVGKRLVPARIATGSARVQAVPSPSFDAPEADRAAVTTEAASALAAARGRPINDPAYLEQRAAAGLARAQARYPSPEAAAAARGRPILTPSPLS
ncbi:M56 family metallopeptidase [Novosphingobium sp.]|uniref:M56 family metallopeptidase n=1 Tax=Novosphingobium sp. TaxID=1874826 RepID=UPI0031DD8607